MRVVCLGGGPAGLYLAISMKLRDPAHEITVIERNRASDTFGWGVVLSAETLDNLHRNDPVSAAAIRDEFAYWDDVAVIYRGERIVSGGHGFCGIGRKKLLNILQRRARELGVELRFEAEFGSVDQYPGYDLIVASDGLNSVVRNEFSERFQPDIERRHCKFVWLGTQQKFDDAFTFIFEQTEHGLVWAHAYQFDNETATFIVECSEHTWQAFGFGAMDQDQSIAACESIFKRHLDGHPLISNARHIRGSAWINFPRVLCRHWSYRNVVLLGDAAATAHFSIGSGTKLAMESAIALADHVQATPDLATAFINYEDERRLSVLRLQSAARNSVQWFETIDRYLDLAPIQFTYSLLTRSQRISHENLRLRDAEWLDSAERWFDPDSAGRVSPRPPMFTPFVLRELRLANRVVVSPMAQYSAVDGTPTDWHMVHLGARAQGGAGLVFTEMTCVSAAGRITPGCPGLYLPEHVRAWSRIVDFVHTHTEAKIALQLGHAGRKGSTRLGWEGMDQPLREDNWSLLAPSALQWAAGNQTPTAMTRDDMDAVCAQFCAATRMAIECNFDLLELHLAHGYLLSSFITPVSNQRDDEYGGSLTNRLRFPLRVVRAVRAIWPAHQPLAVRLSATDWVGERGIQGDDAVAIAAALKECAVDIIDVSAGQTSADAKPVYGRMFQTPFADQIRNDVGIPTMAVGNIYAADHVNSILMAGRADLCCLARAHLSDPNWTLHAAAEMGYDEIAWPRQYWAGRDQLTRLAGRSGATFDV